MADRPNLAFLVATARGAAGALIFALPMLMTMEMFEIGATADPGRLLLLTGAMLPVLYLLAYFVGFEDTPQPIENLLDAFAAYGIGFVTSAIVLWTFAVIGNEDSYRYLIGIVALQAVPASIGALLAQSTLGGDAEQEEEHERQERAGYWGSLFFMLIGALFLSFNVAPTEEVAVLAEGMEPIHLLAALAGSLVVMHAFVYGVEFSGRPLESPEAPWWSLFARYTVTGYALSLLTGAALLWVLGQMDGVTPAHAVAMTVVLGVPSSVGAAAARLIL